MAKPDTNESLNRDLQGILDVYGADASRWPQAQRARLAPLMATDASARAAINEAAALDTLLDSAPRVGVDRERALAARIMAAADAVGIDQAAPTRNVLDFQRRRVLPAATGWRALANPAASALLAASLMLGIFAGFSGQFTPAVDALAVAAGLGEDELELAFLSETAQSGDDTL